MDISLEGRFKVTHNVSAEDLFHLIDRDPTMSDIKDLEAAITSLLQKVISVMEIVDQTKTTESVSVKITNKEWNAWTSNLPKPNLLGQINIFGKIEDFL